MITLLQNDGWAVRPEVSYSEFGERGSIDILAFHPKAAALLVIEVKSVVPDLQEMLMRLDAKARLGPVVAKRVDWTAASVSRLLVLPDDRTARRRVAQHAATFAVALPDRTMAIKRWLRSPVGAIAGVLFLSDANQDGRGHPTEGSGPGTARRPRSAVTRDRLEP